jgi:hypothetical protein
MLNELFAVKNHMWEHRQAVGNCITAFLNKQSDGLYEVTIKKFTERRTGSQNRYYWKLIGLLSPELGYHSVDSCHVMIMEECELGHYVKFKDKQYFERKSSAELDKETFGKLIDKCLKSRRS